MFAANSSRGNHPLLSSSCTHIDTSSSSRTKEKTKCRANEEEGEKNEKMCEVHTNDETTGCVKMMTIDKGCRMMMTTIRGRREWRESHRMALRMGGGGIKEGENHNQFDVCSNRTRSVLFGPLSDVSEGEGNSCRVRVGGLGRSCIKVWFSFDWILSPFLHRMK